jgi:uncharacterized protein YcbK (DUF882 family)
MPAAKYFTDQELACKHCSVNGTTQTLRDALDAFRTAAGVPVIVDDAYRCPEHNKAVGGVPNSQHVLGTAADIKIAGLKAFQLEAIAKSIGAINGIGRDDHKDYIHVDVRLKPAHWCYGLNGQQETYYPYTAGPQNTGAVGAD